MMIHPDVACLLCNSRRWELTRPFGEYKIWGCRQCNFQILFPQPTADILNKLYSEEYFTINIKDQMPDTEEKIQSEINKRSFFIDWFNYTIKKSPGNLLEVGCATGFLLKAFEQTGWHVTGIEFSKDASAYARNILNLDVRTGSVSRQTLLDDQFDIISLMHTLEHLPDPLATLKLLRSHLKNEGDLIIQVPNITSLSAKWAGNKWDGWSIPYHLYHFSPPTLSRLLELSGFRIWLREYSLPAFETRLLQKVNTPVRSTSAVNPAPSAYNTNTFRWRKRLLHWNKKLPLGRDTLVVSKIME